MSLRGCLRSLFFKESDKRLVMQQHQIAELSEELELMKKEKVSIVERLREREKTLADTKTALSNLQNVLRDIGIDHQAQVAEYENSIAELKQTIEHLGSEILQLRKVQDSLEAEKQSLEDGTIHLREEIKRKDTVSSHLL
ncbi:unnamed protein product [Gongylonema pulchrum]|uniref:Myosin_tail_1 domain-containing protein n=1 Tax=Gongylonema pulchrum TaxID=637853 RepID=A0A183ETG9_9BILA|nr:unnamed protein product [Gongylonema pulchrum]